MNKVRSVKTVVFDKGDIKKEDGFKNGYVTLKEDKKHGRFVQIGLFSYRSRDEFNKYFANIAIRASECLKDLYLYIVRVNGSHKIGLVVSKERLIKE